MNIERDLDRLIDEAAQKMVRREPSEGLSRAVMARVSSGATRFVWKRQQWVGFAAAVALAGVAIFVGFPRQAPSVETPTKVQGSGFKTQGSGLGKQGLGLKAQGSGAEGPSRIAGVASRREAVPADEVVPIDDPIVFEAISPLPIEVERLEITSIEIEPISSAND